MATFPLTERNQVRRLKARGNYDRDVVHGILDEAIVCHVGFVTDGQPYVIPTIHVRVGAESTFVPSLVGNSAQAIMLTGAPTDGKTLSSDGLPVNSAGTTYLPLFFLNKSGIFAVWPACSVTGACG